ncbi:MAG: transcriptional repressor LexA [Clostridiales bacterium]|jgi:repressor LexA|nr:transcriptional repressor LexA [Clostridiales bacterium]
MGNTPRKYGAFRRSMRVLDGNALERVFGYITGYQMENGASPSVREIMNALRLGSPSTARRYVDALCARGSIAKDGDGSIETPDRFLRGRGKPIPLIGGIACGAPIFAAENIEESYFLPEEMLGRGEFFMLRARGDSMIEAGIDSGDLVIIKKQSYADDGQVAAALIEDEATLKRFYRDIRNRRFRLHPENECYADIYTENCEILGIAVKIIKDIR